MPAATLEHRCPHCGSRNRLPARRAQDDPACGRCRAALFYGEPLAASDASFASVVEGAGVPALVDFWAPWCGPCRSMEPALRALARDWRGRAQVVKVNVDENPELAARFGVRSIPALKVLRGGVVVDEVNGAVPAQALSGMLEKQIALN